MQVFHGRVIEQCISKYRMTKGGKAMNYEEIRTIISYVVSSKLLVYYFVNMAMVINADHITYKYL